ncbi:hypothetical protein KUV62_08070 [Salipiger bermudensis]|nr:hypothetical protein [Salipiger bermudensis]
MGSVFGLIGALTSWLAFDVSFGSAVLLYFATALSFGLLPVIATALRGNDDTRALAASPAQ